MTSFYALIYLVFGSFNNIIFGGEEPLRDGPSQTARRGARMLQEQHKAVAPELAMASRRLADGGCAVALLRVFAAGFLFLFNVFSWDFFGGFLESIRDSFRLGLALRTPLGRNKVVRLG